MNNLQTIKRRFNFVVTLTLFFPIILQALYQEDIEAYGLSALAWGIVAAVLIANFLLLEVVSNNLAKWELCAVSWLLFGNIFLFVPTILIIGSNSESLSQLLEFIFKVTLGGLFFIPCVVFILLLRRLAVNFF